MVVPPHTPKSLEALLFEALDKTPDGFAIFDPQDRVIYANQTFADLFCDQTETLVGKTFREASLQTFHSPCGLNIETDDIEAWIEYALSRRRQQPFRSFQTDTTDGRWVQITEQLLEDGHMLVYFTDITQQKANEAELQHLTEKLRHLAQTDGLTGTNNRRHFMSLSQTEVERCRRENQPCSILAIDADHFKQINDRFGHPGGDQVLIDLVKVLEQTMRPYDILGRIGGEEFAILVPGADLELGSSIAERLRQAVANHAFSYQGPAFRVTISVGLAVDDGQQPLQQLFAEADRALYRAKRKGRNQMQSAY